MAVMAAQMRNPRSHTGVIKPGFFRDWQGIKLGPEHDRRPVCCAAKLGQDSVSTQTGYHLIGAKPPQGPCNCGCRFRFPPRNLGAAVQVAPKGDQISTVFQQGLPSVWRKEGGIQSTSQAIGPHLLSAALPLTFPSSKQGKRENYMRILITNDDGINAPGLAVLHAIASDIAGDKGEVWTVAPAFEQSGVGHCISYSHPMMIARLSDRRFAAEGSPADCVIAAIYDVFDGAKPDLVLSGVNRGNNAAENTLYSGTIGGAMEAALQGIPAIALSQYMGRGTEALDTPFEAAAAHGAATVRALLEKGLWTQDDYRIFYNVNFPPVAAGLVRGTKVAAQGFRRDTSFSCEPQISPTGRRYLWIKGGPQHTKTLPGTDADVNLDGYISVTPMRADLTAHDLLADLEARLA